MEYREFEVPQSLQRHIRCLWRFADPNPSAAPQIIWPDACCELIVNLAEPMQRWTAITGWQRQSATLFAAQLTAPIRLAADGPVHCIGIRLQPAASATIARQRLIAARDQVVDLMQLDAQFTRSLVGQIARFDRSQSTDALWQFLELSVGRYVIDARVEAAIYSITAADGDVRIEAIAARAELSARGFQQCFHASVGLRAKEFARVIRLQASLRLLDSGALSLADVAADAGFADQAHATRELRRLTGHTPARLLLALREARDGDRTLALAAAFVRGFSA